VIVALLRRLVLSRVANLRGDVRKISAATDMSGRVTPAGNDELTDLALSINEMLGSLQRAREEQREGEEKYRAVVEQTNEAILLADAGTGRFIEANAAGQILLGYDRDELLGMTVSDVVETQEKERDNTRLNTAPRATAPLRLSIEQRYRRKNGTSVHVEVSQIPITYGGREVRCIVARDITERKRAEDLLRELAMRDGLTGLYNRREMHRILKEQVEAYRRYAEPFTLIMLDIDYFKSVNDTYGHQVGDDVIRWIAAVTQDLVRVGDKVARYGGEEVALILPRTGREPAFEVAERIRQSIAKQPFEFVLSDAEGHEGPALIPLTVSLGLATLPDDGATEDEIIKAADTALYTAKRQGRNRTVTHAMTELERQPQVGAVGRN
jgi:diguanylate cyclase (GGDEF)-like protein/PAS domain S-box-containing protein